MTLECIDCGAECAILAEYYCRPCRERRWRNTELRAYAAEMGRAGWRNAIERGAAQRGNAVAYVGGGR